jgi:acyl carrier protein
VTPMVWPVTAEMRCETAYAPIGRPVGERTSYIVDADLNLAPVGVVGELYMGGAGLARGYRGRPGLTAERFVPDPFGEEAGGRLYRTGDLGRWREDGAIEYVGRVDHQVKIRGYRIELGEIEAQILSHPGVREAVVMVRGEHGNNRLVGYVVPSEGSSGLEELKGALRRALPEHMVPSEIVTLEQMPRTPNGKVDRKRLPETERVQREYIEPRTIVEKRLAEIWQEVLGVPRVGMTDSFFDLGGHSLLAIRIVSRIKDALDVELTVRHVFEAIDLQALAASAEMVRREPSEDRGRTVDKAIMDAMEELEALSPEELAALLADE